MIGLDTNILVRWFMQDDPVQSPKANALIGRLTKEEPAFVSVVTTAETVWVLERSYGLDDVDVVDAVEALLQAEGFVMDRPEAVFAAKVALEERGVDFADALIAALGEDAGCGKTLTFDRKAARSPGFELL